MKIVWSMNKMHGEGPEQELSPQKHCLAPDQHGLDFMPRAACALLKVISESSARVTS